MSASLALLTVTSPAAAQTSLPAVQPSEASQPPDATHSNELLLATGEGGFLSTWFKLGPFAAPKYVTDKKGAMETWNPVETFRATDISLDAQIAHRKIELLCGDTERIGLKPATGVVNYLIALIDSPKDASIYLSSASTDGIQIYLNGAKLHSAATHSRWIRKDVTLTSLPLTAGRNLLVIKLFKEFPGRWSTFIRLMEPDFERAHITVAFPGALTRLPEVLQAAARLKVNRLLNFRTGTIIVDAWLQFTGAKPLAWPLENWRWSTDPLPPQTEAPVFEASPINLLHPQTTSYLLQRFEGADSVPERLTLQFNGAAFSAPTLVRPGLVKRLTDIGTRFFTLSSAAASPSPLPPSSMESVEWRIEMLASMLRKGESDIDFIQRELSDTEKMVAAMEAGEDPYANKKNQLQRRGYRSFADGALHPYALYVPPGWKEDGDQQFALVVSLHGLNGNPVKAMTSVFGIPMGEEETREQRAHYEGPIGPASMFVVAPDGFGNSGYYALGEQDIIDVIEIVKQRYRIDENRIYVTGASMGGTGAARVALHYPSLFAAAVPLCGYHNTKYYSQVKKQPLLPEENYLLDVHSNIRWAKNGAHIPMHLVHGTKDFPRQSKDLLEHYRLFGYDATLTLLDAGHNVWDDTYKNRWIFTHFATIRRNAHPRQIQFRTANLRYNTSGWLRIDDAANPADWAEVDGTWNPEGQIVIQSSNVDALSFLHDDELGKTGIAGLSIDGQTIPVSALNGKETTFVRKDGNWGAAPFSPAPMTKIPGLSGPLGDAEGEPLLFVYGTQDPYEGTLARRIIGHLNPPRYGMTVRWRVKADAEVTAQDIENYSIVLVGTPGGNKLLGQIAQQLPIGVKDGAIQIGQQRFPGNRVAASFIYPNPLNPNRYVVVHTGVSREALYFTAHLPAMVPDFVIYDASDWGVTEGYVLGEGRSVLKAGFFDKHWRVAQP